MTAELVIRGGTVIDGTGQPGRRGDVAITNGRISAVGKDLKGEQVLDASEQVVAPGFIDIHTHYDAQVFWDPALTPSCYHGVTTVIAGNCGFSLAPTRPEHRELMARTLENVEDMDVAALAAGIPWDFSTFPEYLESVERRGVGLNYGAYIGHTPMRIFAMGDEAYEREASSAEIARMQALLREALLAGAVGFATSFALPHRGVDGKPVPSRLATRAEFDALLSVLSKHGRGVLEISPGAQCEVADMYELQPRTGVPFTYGALLAFENGAHKPLLKLHQEGWARGVEVWPQVTPRPLTFSFTLVEPFPLNMNPMFGGLIPAPIEERRRAYGDPAWRERTLQAWRDTRGPIGADLTPRWGTYEVAETAVHPELIGHRLTAVASERGTSPFETMLDLAIEEPDVALRVRCVIANDDPDEVARLLTDEHCTLGLSDAGAHVGQLCDASQATDFLGDWVRDRHLMPLEPAVRKLTGLQADLMGLSERGYVRPGAWADIVVFDPDSVSPGPIRRVRDFPANSERLTADQPSGIRHILVNGIPVQVDGARAPDDRRPGHVLRPTARSRDLSSARA